MTATLVSQKARRLLKEQQAAERKAADPYALPRQFGWPNYVVATWQFKRFVDEHRKYWQAQYSPVTDADFTVVPKDDDGWKTLLSMHASQILRKTPEAVTRRLYDVTAEKAQIISAEYADAVCLTLGLHLERDAELTILPGCIRLARELVEERSLWEKVTLDKAQVNDYARRLLWLSYQIVHHPEKHDEMVAKAPLDALRPLR